MIGRATTGVVFASLIVFSACGDNGSSPAAEPTPCTTPAELSHARLPSDFRLDEFADIVDVEDGRHILRAEAVTTTSIIELYPPLAHSVLDAGFEILAGDNEGFEAEIFFASKRRTGAYRLREGPCEDLVTIKLVYGKRAPT